MIRLTKPGLLIVRYCIDCRCRPALPNERYCEDHYALRAQNWHWRGDRVNAFRRRQEDTRKARYI